MKSRLTVISILVLLLLVLSISVSTLIQLTRNSNYPFERLTEANTTELSATVVRVEYDDSASKNYYIIHTAEYGDRFVITNSNRLMRPFDIYFLAVGETVYIRTRNLTPMPDRLNQRVSVVAIRTQNQSLITLSDFNNYQQSLRESYMKATIAATVFILLIIIYCLFKLAGISIADAVTLRLLMWRKAILDKPEPEHSEVFVKNRYTRDEEYFAETLHFVDRQSVLQAFTKLLLYVASALVFYGIMSQQLIAYSSSTIDIVFSVLLVVLFAVVGLYRTKNRTERKAGQLYRLEQMVNSNIPNMNEVLVTPEGVLTMNTSFEPSRLVGYGDVLRITESDNYYLVHVRDGKPILLKKDSFVIGDENELQSVLLMRSSQ